MTKRIIYYKTIDGYCPYDEWLNSLDYKTKSIIDNRIERLIIILLAGSDKDEQKIVIKQAEKYLKDFIERNKK